MDRYVVHEHYTNVLRSRLRNAVTLPGKNSSRKLSQTLRRLRAQGYKVGFHTENGRYYPIDTKQERIFMKDHTKEMFVLEEVEYYDG